MAQPGEHEFDRDVPAVLRLPEADVPVVDALLDGVVVADVSGTIVYANHAVESLLGWPPEVLRGQPVTVVIPPRLRPAHLAAFGAFAAGGRPRLIGHALRVHALRADGTEAPIELLLSALPLRSGERLAVATLRNAAERVDLERHGQVVDRILELLAQGPVELGPRLVAVLTEALDWDVGVLWTLEQDGSMLRAREFWHRPGVDADKFREATVSSPLSTSAGLPGRVYQRRAPAWILDLDLDDDFPRADAARASGLRSGFAFPVLDGSAVVAVIELFSASRREPDDGLLAAMGVIGERLGQLQAHAEAERERERLLEELRSAHEAERSLLRAQDFLLRAARALAHAEDYTEALDRLAAVAVPLLGDLCLIDVLADDGTLIRMAARHADPAKQRVVDELRTEFPPDPHGSHPSVEVIRTGQSRWAADMPEDFLRATTRDQRHLELVRQLAFTSYMSVPLTAEGRVLGALTLVSAGSGRRFGEADLALAEELAGHAAAVIDRARRYDREREAAHALQRSLLPEVLPTVAGVTAAARYLPGTEGAEVGGDWYDLVPLGEAMVGLAIGDVAGHDIGAAAEMGQLRNVLRAYALRDDAPASVLDELRRFCRITGVERMATVAYASLSTATGELRVATAGHLPPLIRRGSGAVEVVAVSPAPPLGLAGDAPVEASVHTEPGDVVVLFTDGLVERPGAHLDEGIGRLAAALGSVDGDPETLCDLVLERVIAPGQRSDDVALLAVARQ